VTIGNGAASSRYITGIIIRFANSDVTFLCSITKARLPQRARLDDLLELGSAPVIVAVIDRTTVNSFPTKGVRARRIDVPRLSLHLVLPGRRIGARWDSGAVLQVIGWRVLVGLALRHVLLGRDGSFDRV